MVWPCLGIPIGRTKKSKIELFYVKQSILFRLVLVAFFLYCGSIALLYVRQYLVNQEPQAADIKIDDSGDPVIYLY